MPSLFFGCIAVATLKPLTGYNQMDDETLTVIGDKPNLTYIIYALASRKCAAIDPTIFRLHFDPSVPAKNLRQGVADSAEGRRHKFRNVAPMTPHRHVKHPPTGHAGSRTFIDYDCVQSRCCSCFLSKSQISAHR